MSFRIETEILDTGTCIKRPVGALTGDSDLSELFPADKMTVILDLAQTTRIDSLGVRNWIREVHKTTQESVVWRRVSPAMAAQIGMISNFVGEGRVESVMVPWWCDACSQDHLTVLETAAYRSKGLETPTCARCGDPMILDELDVGYIEAVMEHAA